MTKLKNLNRGLGRGLDSLLAGDMGSVGEADSLLLLKIEQLQAGKYQPRSHMDDADLQTLAASIKSQGIMQPILVRRIEDERYEIIAGERRWRASQMAGLEEVPVLVREIGDEAALVMALIENIQRENLNALEEAQGINRLIDEFNMTHEEAGLALGRSRVAVSNLLRLLTLCPSVQEMLMQKRLDMGHARALIGLSESQQLVLAENIAQNNLSVREVENLVKNLATENIDAPHKPIQTKPVNHDFLKWEEALSHNLGAAVSIQAGAKGAGTLKITYANLDQLDEIISKISR